MRHTRGYWAGNPAAYFALHRKGFVLPPASRRARWAFTPPFHPYRTVARAAVYSLWHCAVTALWDAAPALEVNLTQHPALWCPDFPLQLSKLARRL